MNHGDDSSYNPQDYNHSQYLSQNYNPSQDYYPNMDNVSNSDMNYQHTEDVSHTSSQIEIQTDTNVTNNAQSWTDEEDIALMSAYCFISKNAIVSNNQSGAKLWKRVQAQYEEGIGEMRGTGEKRSTEALRQRYKRLNANVTKWIGAYKKAYNRRTSGQSKVDIEKAAQALYGKTKFTHKEVFEKVMCHNPRWELVLNSTGWTRPQPDEDSLEESRGSTKKTKTNEDGDSPSDSTPVSDASTLQRPSGRDKAKANAKRKGKGKEAASHSYGIPTDFTATLEKMRLTREKECDIQERKMKTSTLNMLMSRRDLSPDEEALKRHLMADLYGM